MIRNFFYAISLFVGIASCQPILAMELHPGGNEYKPVFTINNNILKTALPQYVKFDSNKYLSEDVIEAQNFLSKQWTQCTTWGDLKDKILEKASNYNEFWQTTYFIKNCMNAMRHIQFLGKNPVYIKDQLVKVDTCDAYNNTLEEYQIGYIYYYPDALLFACALGNSAVKNLELHRKTINDCRNYTFDRFNEIYYHGKKITIK